MYYGLTRITQLFEMIEDVVEAYKVKNENTEATKMLLLGTVAQETKLGKLRDPTAYAAGSGIAQFDNGDPFEDVIQRGNRWKGIAQKKFGIDLDKVRYRELELSALLGLNMARIKYKLVPYAIPETVDGQWKYYKRYYNSYQGKATREEYLNNFRVAKELWTKWKCGLKL